MSAHTIKQYHIPIQVLYNFELRKSTIFVTPKIGITYTYHIETINFVYPSQGETWEIGSYNPYTPATLVNYYYNDVSIESGTAVKKIIPSLSGGLSFKFISPKLGTLELGLNAIYKIKNPTHNYTIHQVKYDATNNSLLSEETEYISRTTKNTVVQFYITWYPNFLRITKNK